MKELDGEEAAAKTVTSTNKAGSDEDAVIVEANGGTEKPSSGKAKKKGKR